MTDASPTIIVVAGAHGNLGSLVTTALRKRAHTEGRALEVRGLVRRNNGAPRTSESPEPGVTIIPVDYSNEAELRAALQGAHTVVSTLQGVEDVIVGVQTRLLDAAIATGVRRFIPSDFALDIDQIPEGANRNFDLRRQFHTDAARIIQQSGSSLELTSIYQGAFTELLGSGWILFDYKKQRVTYFGSPDTVTEYTTWRNTAEYTAAVALDDTPTPRNLYIAGQQLSPTEAHGLAQRVTGAAFPLKRVMSVRALRIMIAVLRIVRPGKPTDPMPAWVGMQYAYTMSLGITPPRFDNDRYDGIEWTPVDETVRTAYEAQQAADGAKR